MKNDKLLLILILIVSIDVLINFVNALGLAMLAYEVRPLVNEVSAKMDSFEMPDFSSVNKLVNKIEPLLELADEFNGQEIQYYLEEFKNFLGRIDMINGADIVIETLPAIETYYTNESWRSCQ